MKNKFIANKLLLRLLFVTLVSALLLFTCSLLVSISTYAQENVVTSVKISINFSPYENEYPKGVVGKTYSIFESTAVDNLGNSVLVTNEVFDSEGGAIPLEGNKFKTDTVGKYTILYKAVSGNVEEVQTVEIYVEDTFEPLAYEFSDKIEQEGSTGEIFYLYNGKVSGGVGVKNEKIILTDSSNNKIDSIDAGTCSYFIPEKEGEYKFSSKITDFVGNEQIFTKNIYITDLDVPVMQKPSVCLTNFKDVPVKLPVIDALFYKDGQKCCVPVKVYFNEQDISETMTYTPTLEGESVIRYVAYNPNDPSKFVQEEFEVNVIDKSKSQVFVGNYFSTDNFEGSYPIDAPGYVLTTQENGQAYSQFKTKIYKEFASIHFVGYKLMNINFEQVQVIFTDSKCADKSVTVSLKEVNKRLILSNRGVECYQSDNNFLTELITGISLSYDYKTNTIIDENDNKVLSVNYYDNGIEFDGFSSDYVYVSFKIFGITAKTQIAVDVVAGNNISDYDRDISAPQFYESEEVVANIDADVGQTISLNCPKAFDIFDDNVTYKLSIRNTTKNTVIYTGEIKDEYLFTIKEAGNYRVEYSAIDSSGEESTKKTTIRVVDRISPKITVKNIQDSVSVGSRFKMPEIVVSDNVSAVKDLKVYTYVTYGNYQKQMIYDKPFTFKTAGEYVFTFTVVDEYSNYTSVEYLVVCK